MEEYQKVIKVPREKYQEFFDGEIWADLKDIYGGKLLYARALLEMEKDHVELLKLQGIIMELKEFVNLPETIMSEYTYEESKETQNLLPQQEEE